ncbi:MAG: pantetheine-phosphate adenylyltransferase [Erysipelotrichia bacterium]|nr:pantetheine-phosphate adenylyltransferase [Erysipelotrichia bacterium]
MRALYPGSFDPVTYGHLDIIERAASLFDELIIVIMTNDEKHSTFTMEERKQMLQHCIGHLENVRVEIGSGLTVDFAEKLDSQVLIRGVRAVSDYEYEMQLATANMTLKPKIETIFLLARPQYSFLSSSTAKTVAKNNGDLHNFVPDFVAEKLREKYR